MKPYKALIDSDCLYGVWLKGYKPKEFEEVLVVAETEGYERRTIYHPKHKGHSGNGLVSKEIAKKYKGHLWHVPIESIINKNKKLSMRSQVVSVDQRETVFP